VANESPPTSGQHSPQPVTLTTKVVARHSRYVSDTGVIQQTLQSNTQRQQSPQQQQQPSQLQEQQQHHHGQHHHHGQQPVTEKRVKLNVEEEFLNLMHLH